MQRIQSRLVLLVLMVICLAQSGSRSQPGKRESLPILPSELASSATSLPITLVQRIDPPSHPSGTKGGAMVYVPAGEFYMGCNGQVDAECFPNEKPGRRVKVEGFWIDQNEAAVAEYRQCVSARSCSSSGLDMPFWEGTEHAKDAWACNWGKSDRVNHPINCLNWEQAASYCRWSGKRLPTEAEWEKAARGTDGRKYPWGNTGYSSAIKVANILDENGKKIRPNRTIAQGYDDGYIGTAPVGSFPSGASPYGALDMIGNVNEWTSTLGNSQDQTRMVRGGSFGAEPKLVRASFRAISVPPTFRFEDLGVRCAR